MKTREDDFELRARIYIRHVITKSHKVEISKLLLYLDSCIYVLILHISNSC